MAQTGYEAKAARAWRLAHEDHRPMKKVASALGVTISEAYELLAYCTARRNAASGREMALGKSSPSKSSSEQRTVNRRSGARVIG
jgi:hypothetical protein